MGKITKAFEKSRSKVALSEARKSSEVPASEGGTTEAGPTLTPLTPPASFRPHRSLITLSESDSLAGEQFRLLKTHLLFGMEEKPLRSIMVTSAMPGEGKSFVAANLAVSISKNVDGQVLLIDCDLRRPSIHKIFGMEDRPGLSEYFSRSGSNLSDFLVKPFPGKLSLILAGRPPENPMELLSSERMISLLKEAKQRYKDRYIILDSPPPRLAAESNALARQVDSVLLVIKGRGAGRDVIGDLVDTIGKEKVAGVVFNHFEMPKLSSLGYGKYGKYGKYKGYYK